MSKIAKVFGGGKDPGAAAAQAAANQQRADEEARQNRIKQGQSTIDASFGQFNDDYYNTREKEYSDYYNPQLDKQYADTLENKTYALARGGNTESSTASKQLGDLLEYYNTQKRGIADKALSTKAALKNDVESQKSSLYGLNSSSADPSLAASRANAAVASLSQPQTFSPLGQIFASFLNTGANAAAAANTRNTANDEDLPGFNFASGGSGNVVR